MKCSTPSALQSNVVYKFNCLGDANISYIGYTACHLYTRAQEHLHPTASAIKNALAVHVQRYADCSNSNLDIGNFNAIKRCRSEYETKIQ